MPPGNTVGMSLDEYFERTIAGYQAFFEESFEDRVVPPFWWELVYSAVSPSEEEHIRVVTMALPHRDIAGKQYVATITYTWHADANRWMRSSSAHTEAACPRVPQSVQELDQEIPATWKRSS